MGCALSSREDELAEDAPNDVVSLCKERKRLIKAAVKQRQAFAEAHSKYILSLSAVSSAIVEFVSLSLSSPSEILTQISDSSTTHLPVSPQFTVSSSNLERKVEAEEEKSGNEGVCEFFYGDDPPEMGGNGWDFFNLSDMAAAAKAADGERKVVGEENGPNGDVGKSEMGEERDGRGLMEALKVVEEQFVSACEGGVNVLKMLEVDDQICFVAGLKGFKENSRMSVQSIRKHRPAPSRTSSSTSLLSFSSTSSSTWTEPRTDHKSFVSSSSQSSSTLTEHRSGFFDGCGGMESGSHSFTLGRIYAWEKKLYHEVKAGEELRKCYKQKCSRLKKHGAGGDDLRPSKTTEKVTGSYHKILVSLRSAESISIQIEKLRDEELQPQLVELLYGLMSSWKIMLESHEVQNKIMREVKPFTYHTCGKPWNDSDRFATQQLEAELRNWQACFSEYVSTQKSYVSALHGWLSKFIASDDKLYFKGKSFLPPIPFNVPNVLVTCHNWLASLEKLPDSSVKYAIKHLADNVKTFWVQQGEEQQHKRIVDGVAEEMEKRALALYEGKRKIRFSERILRRNDRGRAEGYFQREKLIDMVRERLDEQKEKHKSRMQEKQEVNLIGIQKGFSSVLVSLADFSRASVKLYGDIVTYSQISKV